MNVLCIFIMYVFNGYITFRILIIIVSALKNRNTHLKFPVIPIKRTLKAPHAVVASHTTIKLGSVLIHNCNFVTGINCNISIFGDRGLLHGSQQTS